MRHTPDLDTFLRAQVSCLRNHNGTWRKRISYFIYHTLASRKRLPTSAITFYIFTYNGTSTQGWNPRLSHVTKITKSIKVETFHLLLPVTLLASNMNHLHLFCLGILLSSYLVTSQRNTIHVQNNAYSNLLIAIHESIPEDPYLVQRIKVKTWKSFLS